MDIEKAFASQFVNVVVLVKKEFDKVDWHFTHKWVNNRVNICSKQKGLQGKL